MADYSWIERIEKGEVLRSGSGTLRVVRHVTHTVIPVGRGSACEHIRTSVVFTIKTCSWTTRCYTILSRGDLISRRFAPTGKRVKLDAAMDQAIEREFGADKKDIKIHCCDVRGVG